MIRTLGRGGAATVYLAELVEDLPRVARGTRVALKVLHADLARSRASLDRFEREAELGRRVSHPALVATWHHGVAEGDDGPMHFLVQEYVEGRSLRELVTQLGRLPEPLARSLAVQAASALAALHAAGTVHRDVKPENLLVTDRDELRLVDLGVADVLEESGLLTTTGRFVGSPLYASPEQFQGGDLLPASDLYSLGVVLYEACTGLNPFSAPRFSDVMARHLTAVPPRASSLTPDMSPLFEEVLHALLAKDPSERLASASELVEVLETGTASRWWQAREPATPATARFSVARGGPVVGRTAELDRLARGLEDVRLLRRGRVALIEGEMGIGRTRLVDELARRAGRTFLVLAGTWQAGGEPVDAALARAVMGHFGHDKLGPEIVRRLRVDPDVAERLVTRLRGRGSETAEPASMLLRELLLDLAAERPLLLVLEDLHHATHQAREAIFALAQAAADRPVMLVLTSRSDTASPELAELALRMGADRLRLERLRAEDVWALVADRVRNPEGAERIGELIARKSAGNPLFAIETLKHLERLGTLDARGSDSAVPPSLRDLARARLGALAPDEREMLDLASVQGESFDPELVAAASGQRVLSVLRLLARVERATGIVRAEGAAYRFDHPLVQEALHDALAVGARRELHAATAGALEARATSPSGAQALRLAGHLLHAGLHEHARQHVVRALEHASVRCEWTSFFEVAGMALEPPLGGDLALRSKIQRLRARAFGVMGDQGARRDAIDDAVRAAREAREPALLVHAQRARASALMDTGEAEEALRTLVDVLPTAIALGDSELEVMVRINVAVVAVEQADYAAALAQAARVLPMARRGRDLVHQAGALRAIGVARARLSQYGKALATFQLMSALCRRAGDREGQATATLNAGTVLLHLGRYEEAAATYEEAVASCRAIGDRTGELLAAGNLGVVEANRGRLDRARVHHQRALRLAHLVASPESVSRSLCNLAAAALDEGQLDEAETHAGQALALARAHSLARQETYALLHLAQLARARGELAAARAAGNEVLRLREALEEPELAAEASLELCRALRDDGEIAAAGAAAARASEALAGLEHAELRCVADALGTLLRGEPGRPVPERAPLTARAEAHLVLHAAGVGAGHLATALDLLERLGAHLRGESRARFWRWNVLARAARAAEAAAVDVEVRPEAHPAVTWP